ESLPYSPTARAKSASRRWPTGPLPDTATAQWRLKNGASALNLRVARNALATYSGQASENQTAVCATESERVGQCGIDIHLPCAVGHIVEMTAFGRLFEINCRRRDLIANGQNTENSFRRTSGTKHVPSHGLGRTDGRIPGGVAHQRLNRLTFRDIANQRRRPMGVDIVNLIE